MKQVLLIMALFCAGIYWSGNLWLNVRDRHEVLLHSCAQQWMLWEFNSDIQLVGLGSYTVLLGTKLRMCEMVIVRYTIILHEMQHMYRLYSYSNPLDLHQYSKRKKTEWSFLTSDQMASLGLMRKSICSTAFRIKITRTFCTSKTSKTFRLSMDITKMA